jgi:ribosomal protein S14
MHLERKNIRIRRDEILRLKYLKKEYIYYVLKSVSKTRMLTPYIRFYAFTRLQKNHSYISRWKNFCLLTGRSKGTTKIFNISRHMLNKLSQQGYVPGFSRNNYK